MKHKLLILASVIAGTTMAQPINEGFEDITTLPAAGWSQQNLSTPAGTNPNWTQGNATSPFAPFAGAGFVFANFNSVAGNNTISNWLFAPNRTFENGDVITFYTRTVDPATYADRLQVRFSGNGASTNAGSTNTSVGDFTTLLLDINPTLTASGYPTTWTQYTITISGLSGPTSGRIAFRYFVTSGGPSGNNSDFIGIDQFVYTPAASAAPDVLPISHVGDYTIIPFSQITALPLNASITNSGSATANNTVLTAKVFLAPDFTNPIQTTTSAAATLSVGVTQAFTASTFTPNAVGQYQIQYISSCTNNSSAANDTLRYNFQVSNRIYARDNGVAATSFGIGDGPTGNLGVFFTINAATPLDSVQVSFNKPGGINSVGDSTRVRIYSVSGGIPNTLIGRSNNYVFTAADTSVFTTKTLAVRNLSGAALTLAPGQYYVGVTENQTNVGLAFTPTIFKPNTVYVSWTNQPWAPVESFGANFARTPLIRPILQVCQITASTNSTNTSCGSSTGTATVTPISGMAPYTYQWSNNATTQTITNLAVGTYTALVTDANGCQATVSAVVTNPNAPTVAFTALTNVSCNGGSDGSLTVTPSGGTAPYTYVWSNQATTQTITNLTAGTYSVTVTDNNGCSTSETISITEPIVLSNIFTPTQVACNGGATGAITATVSGGTMPYTYLWSNMATTATVTGLSAGTYNLTVTDANGCTLTLSQIITEPSLPLSATTSSTVSSGTDGTATVTASGGTPPYSYLWSPSNQNTATASGLAGGNYTVTVTDANGCTQTSTVHVGTLGLEEVNLLQGLTLYPNPTHASVYLDLGKLFEEKVTLTMTNALGQIISKNEVVNESIVEMDTDLLEPGVYWIEIRIESGDKRSIQFVKQ